MRVFGDYFSGYETGFIRQFCGEIYGIKYVLKRKKYKWNPMPDTNFRTRPRHPLIEFWGMSRFQICPIRPDTTTLPPLDFYIVYAREFCIPISVATHTEDKLPHILSCII